MSEQDKTEAQELGRELARNQASIANWSHQRDVCQTMLDRLLEKHARLEAKQKEYLAKKRIGA